ncbi:MAG: TonB-dependent receptor [Rhodocyclales bacterium]|nr:TonB-dependent receptor [Rhodocyclales bacterium]
MSRSALLRAAAALLGACAPAGGAQAQADAAAPLRAAPVVVTATRVEQSSFDLPVSVDRVGAAAIQEQQLQVNLSESLGRVPGVVVQNRQNYAQDLQISSRGFGARSTFGIRGIRLYADGIPATMPDGQGQASHFDLAAAARIEVLRGPFSALYGNSSGGVIALFTADGKPGANAAADVAAGSFGTQRLGLKAAGERGGLNYALSAAAFRSDGYRDHSAASRDTYNAKLRVQPDAAATLSFVFNAHDMPQAQDPLGLTRAQFDADPRQAGTNALPFDARKRVAQSQGGLAYERHLSASDTLAATLYSGRRGTIQFQAIATAAQVAATSAGGVIDLIRDYGGCDLRWTRRTELAGAPLRFSAGLAYENVDERRRGYQNFTGAAAAPTAVGVRGPLRRDEDNRVFSFDQYVQGEWQPGRRWLVLAGLRNSAVQVRSGDHYVAAGNGDDSGSIRFSAANPVLGITFKADEALNLYASYGRGFETPTLNELSYRTSGSGLNLGLKPARGDHLEAGAKAFLGADALATVAFFHVATRDEIAVLSNTGGRSVFQNVGGSRRDGAELALDARLPGGFGAYAAYTYLNARYADDFLTCTAAPCAAPIVPVAAGNAIPGIPRTTLNAELSWRHAPAGFSGGLEVRRAAQVFVNDVNSDAAPAYTALNLRLGFEQQWGNARTTEFLRIDNLADRKYAGSVIVNEGNSRFFEPAPGRAWLLGVGAQLAF